MFFSPWDSPSSAFCHPHDFRRSRDSNARKEPNPHVVVQTAVRADGSFAVRASAPRGYALDDVEARLVDDGATLVIEGRSMAPPVPYEYIARRRVPVFAEPLQRDYEVIGFLNATSVVRGGPPLNSGWIALEDDESWILNDGSIALAQRGQPARPVPFAKRVALPADAALCLTGATCERVEDGLEVIVPSKRLARTKKTKKTPSSASQHPCTETKAKCSTSSTSTPPSSPTAVERMHSDGSSKTLEELAQIGEQLARMSAEGDGVKASLDHTAAALEAGDAEVELDRTLRNRLNQLHGDTNRLLATRIDAILVSELTSAKEEARAKRKSLTRSSEALIERLEHLVVRFDEIRGKVGRTPTSSESESDEKPTSEKIVTQSNASSGGDMADIVMV